MFHVKHSSLQDRIFLQENYKANCNSPSFLKYKIKNKVDLYKVFRSLKNILLILVALSINFLYNLTETYIIEKYEFKTFLKQVWCYRYRFIYHESTYHII